MHPYTTSKKRRLRLFSQLTGWLNCPGTKIIPARSSVLDFFYCVLYFFCSTFTIGSFVFSVRQEMNICYNRLDFPYPPRLAMFLAVEHSILGLPSGKCQRGEFVYLLHCGMCLSRSSRFVTQLQMFTMDFAVEKDGTQLQVKNFDTCQAFTSIKI